MREVWVYDAQARHERGRFTLHALGADGYEPVAASAFFPDVDLEVLATHVAMPDQDAAVRAYWAWLGAKASG